MPGAFDRSTDAAAVEATARAINSDDARAVAQGEDLAPADEVVAEPDPSDYLAPEYLAKTGTPELAGAFQVLLDELRDLNRRFARERTVEVQAYLSLTGEHDELEE